MLFIPQIHHIPFNVQGPLLLLSITEVAQSVFFIISQQNVLNTGPATFK